MITVVLTKHKREHLFDEQYKAVMNQTIKPDEVLICTSKEQNLGVWSRFSIALHAKNEFVNVIDDDTIPGSRWLENCYTHFMKQPGLYGTCGLRFFRREYYDSYTRVGWCNPNNVTIKVDYLSHSWFFKKDWLKYFWSEIPDPKYFLCGEDMNFSYQLQKQGIDTFVPPHPENDRELWGSLKGYEYGTDENSLYENNVDNFRVNMLEFFYKQLDKGWMLQYEILG